MALKKVISNQRAQVVVEYVMILFICVSIGVILSQRLISRDSSDPSQTGKIISAWDKILVIIGNDLPDCPGQDDFTKPNCR